MTTTPMSLDESLNGSWVDINSPSQIHSPPINSESAKYQRPPYSLAESVQHLGVISYQVEKLLQQEAEKELNRLSQGSHQHHHRQYHNQLYGNHNNIISRPSQDEIDNVVDVMDNIDNNTTLNINNYNNNSLSHSPPSNPKSPPIDLDYLSDSLSLVEAMFDKQAQSSSTDWLWDWTAKPEYFSKEWKMQQPLKRSKLSLRQWASKKGILSREVVSLLFLTNILSIIIGAGISYSILIKRPLS